MITIIIHINTTSQLHLVTLIKYSQFLKLNLRKAESFIGFSFFGI